MKAISRRAFLKGSIAGTAVVGFNVELTRWVAHAAPASDTIPIPNLDGELLFDPSTLQAASEDFGHIVSETPWAVLLPGSMHDVEVMVQFANAHGLQIASMSRVGCSHSTFGQAQVDAGIVIDMSVFAEIDKIETTTEEVWVDAGVYLRDLVGAAFAYGKSPPVLPDYTGLSVGGVIAVGGIGGQTQQVGLFVDNVTALDVVTGSGERLLCSATENENLFRAARGGLGQFALVLRALVRLRDVPAMARVYSALYDDIHAFTCDQERLVAEGRFDYLEGFAVPNSEQDGWAYALEAVAYFDPGAEPDDEQLLAGLAFIPETQSQEDRTYVEFITRLDATVTALQEDGDWYLPHPWLNLFLPRDVAPWFIQAVLSQTTPDELGGGPILIYPFQRSLLEGRYPVAPSTDTCYLFALLRTANPGTRDNVDALLAKNLLFLRAANLVGGKLYPVSAVPMQHFDWVAHFGLFGSIKFQIDKCAFDPQSVLTPGQRIRFFPSTEEAS